MSDVQVFSKPVDITLVVTVGLFTPWRWENAINQGCFVFSQRAALVSLHLGPRGPPPAQYGDLPLAERKRSLGKLWVCS